MNATEATGSRDRLSERFAAARRRPYQGIEAALGLSGYLVAQVFCAQRRVLDVSCGEGYGAFLMAEQWNAASVVGVDASPETIQSARHHFSSERVAFREGTPERIHELYGEADFDLIVSLETIHRLQDPAAFLRAAARLLKPSGVMLISCPRDQWCCGSGAEGCPPQAGKYTFEEFRALTESVLGPAGGYLLGAPVSGFVNFADDRLAARLEAPASLILEGRAPTRAVLLPTEEVVNASNCRYYIGVWGAAARDLATVAAYATSVDSSADALRQVQLEAQRDEVLRLRKQLRELSNGTQAAPVGVPPDLDGELQRLFEELQREVRHNGLRAAALAAENEFLREQLLPAVNERDQLRARVGDFPEHLRPLAEAHEFIRHLEETIANCHRELAKSPYHRAKRLARRMIDRMRGRSRGGPGQGPG